MKNVIKFTLLGIVSAFLLVFLVGLGSGENFLYDLLGAENSEEQMVEDIQQGMLNREEYVTVTYIGERKDIKQMATDVVEDALNIDDSANSSDFDYLRHICRGYTASMRGFAFFAEITYNFSYSETKEQSDWVDSKVKKLILSFHLENKSEYEKVKKIHDYIIKNISYDVTVQYNSAYEGLNSKATACEGYANLAYKMYTVAGINCRVITGMADGEAHAWNIVEIDGVWYNIDCTWDDPIGGGNNNQYNYFLKSNYDFTDHIRDEEYNSESFNLDYPMSVESWKKK